jgi:hypothetical protein
MENDSLKSSFYGKIPELKPTSRTQFEIDRELLLNLLFNHNQENKTPTTDIYFINSGELLQNFPNPFVENTQIWYKTDKESYVEILISDLSGKKIRTINEGIKEKGLHSMYLQLKGIAPGTYFYSLIINGRICDTKKMSKLN